MNVTIPFELVDIEGDGCHLLIDALLNDHGIRMLIDTGASRTVFDRSRIGALVTSEILDMDRLSAGLGTNSMSSQKALISNLCFGDICLDDYTAVFLDLSHVNESYLRLGYTGIDGVLGGDILQKLNAVIDYSRKMLVISE